jgi:hypothetical protein
MAQLSPRAFETHSAHSFASAVQLDLFFKTKTGADFVDWFNQRLAGKGAFADRRIRPDAGEDISVVKREFAEFWDTIPVVFAKPAISLFDFAALMCITINETGGRFRSRTEICGRGAKDSTGRRHEGVSYAFDRLPNIKKSYNTLAGNRTARACFCDPVFCLAHRDLALADQLSGVDDPTKVSAVWDGELYPFEQFPVVEDLEQTGFIMQADFYKFRGRGPIQITGRAPYRKLVAFIQSYTGPNTVLQEYKAKWQTLTPDEACSASRDSDWDEIFREKMIVPHALRAYADLAVPSKNMFSMQLDLDKLNAPTRQAGSFFSVGRIISGTDDYAKNKYLPRVVEMLEALV